MAPDYFKNWTARKVAIVRALARGEAGCDYHEAGIIASAALGTIAGIAWPVQDGELGTDRKRFVEVWARFAPPELEAGRISIPLLVASLEGRGDVGNAAALRRGRRSFAVDMEWTPIPAAEVDISSDEVRRLAPSLSLRAIRRFSYGSVFYGEVRSGLVHGYNVGDSASWSSIHADERSLVPCYVNPIGNYWVKRGLRQIYFPLSWIVALLEGVATRLIPVIDCWPTQRPPRPAMWWADGG